MGKGDVLVKHVGLLSFKNYSLVTSSGETCCYCATWRSRWVGDTSSFGVVVFYEGTSNKGNHFLNRMFKIGLEKQLSILVLLKTKLVALFF